MLLSILNPCMIHQTHLVGIYVCSSSATCVVSVIPLFPIITNFQFLVVYLRHVLRVGTIGLEIIDSIPDLDVLVIPVGGGGMISGIAKAVKQIKPNIRIVGVEPSKIPSMRKAIIDHDLSPHPPVTTIADGINVSLLFRLSTHRIVFLDSLLNLFYNYFC